MFNPPEEGQPAKRFLRFDTQTSERKRSRRHLLNPMGRGVPIIGRSAYALDRLKPEERALFEGPDAMPWKITLWILDHEHSVKFRPVTYFMRNRIPDRAITLAEAFWRNIEKVSKGLGGNKFPDALGKGEALCLDEGDWREYYHDALKFGKKGNLRMFFKGPQAHPLMFTVPGLVFDVDRNQQPGEEDWERAHTTIIR